VRKRSWRTRGGEIKEAWIVDYADQHGERHIKTFQLKRDADAYHARVCVDVTAGVHTADSKSVMVIDAGRLWIESGEASKLERTTLEGYRMLLDLHIVPFIGAVKLAQLTVPMVRAFEDQLRADRSPAMVRKALVALSSILSDAQERGLVAQNVVYSLRRGRHTRRAEGNGKLKAGIDIPTPAEVRAIVGKLDAAAGRHGPVLLTAIFTGLRASELRGLRWDDVDLKRGELHVRQRADRYGKIGRPKSEAGERTVPLPPMVVAALREHRLASPKGELGLVFPNSRGGVEHRNSIVKCGFHPAQIAAGVVDQHGGAFIAAPI
jgi:integrase